MFVELVYDKCNVEGFEGVSEIILVELMKQVYQIFFDVEVRVKLMQVNCLNSDINKSDCENLNRQFIKNRFILNYVIYIQLFFKIWIQFKKNVII